MKILVIRFSSIGDIILTSPVIRCLYHQRSADIDFLTKKQYSSLVSFHPFIQKVHPWHDDSKAELLEVLKQENYDVIVDLHNNIRSHRIRKSLGCRSFGFDKINVKKWLAVNLKLDVLPKQHLVDRYFSALQRHLDIQYDHKGLDFYGAQQPAGLTEKSFVCLAIGGSFVTKKLPESKLNELCRKLDCPVVIIGGSEDEEFGLRLAQHNSNVINHAGQLSLLESAGVILASSVVISHDTGMMHIAAALKKPLLSIWGNTIPEFGMYPFYPSDQQDQYSVHEVMGLSCRPCSKLGHKQCPKKHFKCMLDQDIDEIINHVNTLLGYG